MTITRQMGIPGKMMAILAAASLALLLAAGGLSYHAGLRRIDRQLDAEAQTPPQRRAAGLLRPAIDREIARGRLREDITNDLLVYGIVIAILILMTALVINRFLVRPLEALRIAMERVRTDIADEWRRAAPPTVVALDPKARRGGFAEMRRLMECFNAMSRTIARRHRDLAASEARFRTIFENSPFAITITLQKNGCLLAVNPAFEKNTGIPSSKALGKTWSELGLTIVQPPDETLREILDHNGLIEKLPVIAKTPLREEDHNLLTMMPIVLDGEAAVLAVSADINDLVLAQRALRLSEAKFKTLFESANEAIFLMDREHFLECNRTAEVMFGRPRGELLGRSPLAFSPPLQANGQRSDEKAREAIAAACAGQPQQFEWTHFRADGTEFTAAIGLNAFELENGTHLQAVLRDITDSRKNEALLRNQQKLEAIGTLAGGIAHEINNPLNVIINFGQLILDAAVQDGQIAEDARAIIAEGERISEIVKNLLAFSRQEKEAHSPARLADIVNSTLILTNKILRKDQIRVEADVPPDLPKLMCRSQQMMQVLMNLLTNARDALNAKYPGTHEDKRIDIRARPFEDEGKNWLRLSVEDRGGGIPEHLRRRIFDPFFTTKPKNVGTGLGLSISYGIVQDHGGRINIESEDGRFTRFNIDLPLEEATEPRTTGNEEDGDESHPDRG